MAQLVEHIVHIDGVTGSSPVATTTIPGRKAWDSFSSCVYAKLYDIISSAVLAANSRREEDIHGTDLL